MCAYGKDSWNEIWKKCESMSRANPGQVFRREYIIRMIKRNTNIKNEPYIIDFGCGTGDLLIRVHDVLPDAHLIGLELSETGVGISQRELPNADIRQCDLIADSPSHSSLYRISDLGICCEVLEHVDEPSVMLTTMKKYIKPEGTLLFSVPGGPMNYFEKSIGHRRHYSAGQLVNLLEKNGFSIIKKASVGFPFFNLYKLVALMRGRRVINDANPDSNNKIFVGFAYSLFSFLFAFNLNDLPWGWQTIVLAKQKG